MVEKNMKTEVWNEIRTKEWMKDSPNILEKDFPATFKHSLIYRCTLLIGPLIIFTLIILGSPKLQLPGLLILAALYCVVLGIGIQQWIYAVDVNADRIIERGLTTKVIRFEEIENYGVSFTKGGPYAILYLKSGGKVLFTVPKLKTFVAILQYRLDKGSMATG